jgi:hypothetical protein
MPITKEEDIDGPDPMKEALDKHKITCDYLVRKLKSEMNAKETKTIKIKGAVSQDDLPKGFKIIAASGTLEYDEKGEQLFGDGETLIRYDPKALGIRQKARQDAHKLRGDYPAEKVEVTATLEDKLRAIHDKREKEDA